MQALYFDGSGLAMRELARPKRKEGEALVRVLMAGICNTDLEIARGYMSFKGVLGHEFVGVVEEADSAHWLGARVAGEINLGCGHCDLCRRGMARHCAERTVLGILGKDGVFAEYVTLPERNLHRVPAALEDAEACFVEPVAACFEILEQVHVSANDRVAVLGDGKLGQLAARVLREHGAQPLLVGKYADKLARAAALGLQTATEGEPTPRSFDLVVEATGSPSGMQLALRLLRPRGTLVLKSTYHGQLSLDAAPLVIDEITLVGSRCGPFAPAIAALASSALSAAQLVDAVFPLASAPDALRKAGEPGVMKVLLDMR